MRISTFLVATVPWCAFLKVGAASAVEETLEQLPVHPLSHLCLEMRDHIFALAKIDDLYALAQFLNSSKTARQAGPSKQFVDRLLEKGARDLASCCTRCGNDGSPAAERILASLRGVVRARCDLPLVFENVSDDALAEMAMRFERHFIECGNVSRNELWQRTCMEALIGKNTLEALFDHFSSPFKEQNGLLMAKAVASRGDFAALELLVQKGQVKWDRSMAEALIPSIAYGGSIEFFDELSARVPDHDGLLDRLTRTTEKWDRVDLFEVALERTLQKLGEAEREKYLKNRLLKASLHGAVKIVKLLDERFLATRDRLLVDRCLFRAAISGNVLILRHFLWDEAQGGESSSFVLEDPTIARLLVGAAENNHVDVLHFLLFDLRLCRRGGMVAVFVVAAFAKAVVHGHFDVVKWMLRTDEDGRLHFPLLNHPESAKAALRGVIGQGRLDRLQYLLEQKGHVCADRPRLHVWDTVIEGGLALETACKVGKIDLVRFLLKRDAITGQYLVPGMDLATQGGAALCYACGGGHVEVVAELLKRDENGGFVHAGIDPAYDANTPLIWAASQGHSRVVEFLLQGELGEDGTMEYSLPGIDPAAQNNAPLRMACLGNHANVVEVLLQRSPQGEYIHRNVVIPNGLIEQVVGWNSFSVQRVLLEHHPLEGRY